jgi:MFS family permease
LIQTSCYAYAANHYPDNKEEVIGYLEAIMGIGNGLGPFLGAALYTVFGFDVAFYTFGATLILFVIVTQILTPQAT